MTLVRSVSAFTLVAALSATPLRADDYPTANLEANGLKLLIHLPDAKKGYYRGTRFDWSGVVSRVEFGKHSMFQEWRGPHNPDGSDDVGGTAEEFGMTEPPLGFDGAKTGGKFLKIGVGILERPDDKEYQFWRNYKIVEAGTWTVEQKENRIEFRQKMSMDGYAYDYTKAITLPGPKGVFAIERSLRNTGTKPIHTDHYGHNFVTFDGKPVGPDYKVTFANAPKPRDKKTDFGDRAALDGPVVTFKKLLDPGTIYTELDGLADRAEQNTVTVEDVKTGVSVKITGDRKLKEMHLWAIKKALCPEPFVALMLAPNESAQWKTTYELRTKRP